jgi:hypothetical protein
LIEFSSDTEAQADEAGEMNGHCETDLPMGGENHDHERYNDEDKLAALVNNDPDLAYLVYQVRASEPDLHELLIPIDFSLILRVSLHHVTVPLDRLILQLNILAGKLNVIPFDHLLLNIDTDCEVQQIDHELLPYVFSVHLKPDQS